MWDVRRKLWLINPKSELQRLHCATSARVRALTIVLYTQVDRKLLLESEKSVAPIVIFFGSIGKKSCCPYFHLPTSSLPRLSTGCNCEPRSFKCVLTKWYHLWPIERIEKHQGRNEAKDKEKAKTRKTPQCHSVCARIRGKLCNKLLYFHSPNTSSTERIFPHVCQQRHWLRSCLLPAH